MLARNLLKFAFFVYDKLASQQLCKHSQTSSKCKTRQSRTANKLLTNPAERWLALNRNRYLILVAHAQTQRTGRLQNSYIPQYFPYRPPMAMAERPFSILKVIVAAQFFSSCYFKVKKVTYCYFKF